jgi:hypothetical protein
MTRARHAEIRKLLGEALDRDVAHLEGIDRVSASIDPAFPTPEYNAAKAALEREFDEYEHHSQGDGSYQHIAGVEE